jgi:hypothetical protein
MLMTPYHENSAYYYQLEIYEMHKCPPTVTKCSNCEHFTFCYTDNDEPSSLFFHCVRLLIKLVEDHESDSVRDEMDSILMKLTEKERVIIERLSSLLPITEMTTGWLPTKKDWEKLAKVLPNLHFYKTSIQPGDKRFYNLIHLWGDRSPEDEYNKDIHTEHCCVQHGCKYLDVNCSVVSRTKTQSHLCDTCNLELLPHEGA